MVLFIESDNYLFGSILISYVILTQNPRGTFYDDLYHRISIKEYKGGLVYEIIAYFY